MSSSPPTTLGQYQIIREIARSNDIVYEAYDPLMNRRVAVKELSMPHGMTDAQKTDRISRFKREAQAAGTLNHPNIMTVHSFAEDAGRTFMAMEFLDGTTLRSEIDAKGFLPVDRAVEIAVAVLEGLGHAHSKGVIHRDIKPDNVQILSTGAVKITDFGIARLTFQPNLTMDGQVFGTPSYMSPEQVVGRDIDARSDLFSVAVVLYEMLSGQKPFAGDSVVSITYAIMNKEPQQPSQCDWGLWQVLSRSLDKSPQLRYGSATEMIEALKTARKQAQSGLMTATPPPNSGFNPNHPNNTPGAYTSPYANPGAGYAPLNPGPATGYGTPPPAPTYNQPQAYGPGGYNQQPYNPYQAPAVAPPPPQYPYNPYQQSVPQPGYGMPPPAPLPIYYPPPPRAPLLKPDTVVFLKKLTVAFVILGTLFALVIVGMSSLARALQNTSSRGEDARVAQQIRALDPQRPLDERIDKARSMMNKLPATDRTASASATADLMAQYARAEMQKNPRPEVETYLFDATTLDPNNANHHALQGKFYWEKAQSASADSKVSLLQQAGDAFEKASNQTSNSASRMQFQQQAAEAYFAAAETLFKVNPDQRASIRELLGSARRAAPSGSAIISRIDEVQNWVRGQAGG
ncbi:MAG: serine/threonine protein kinase [Fimbriimonas sp.]